MYPSPNHYVNLQETAWSISRQSFERGIAIDPCVFKVPKSLSSVKPEAYSPQLVGLAPYHHTNPQLWNMERVKVDAAFKIHEGLTGDRDLEPLVEKFRKLYLYICGCYHMFVEDNNLLLARIMVIDTMFLFGAMCLHGIRKTSLMASNDLRKLAELSLGKKLAGDAILRDVMMLENQIPIFIVERMLLLQCPSNPEIAKDIFPKILVNFCGAVSPFKETAQFTPDKALKRAHLLDLLYHMIVPAENLKDYKIDIPEDLFVKKEEQVEEEESDEDMGFSLFDDDGDIEVLKLITNVPMLGDIATPMGLVGELLNLPVSSFTSAIQSARKAIQTDAVVIPSIPTASSLSKVGITFDAAKDIKSINFDKTTKRFQLPAMELGVNSEVIIRNLVAYEAMIEADNEDDVPKQTPDVGDCEPESNEPINDVEAQVQSKNDEKKPLLSKTGLVLARHMELMNELIDSAEDVQVFKDQGLIISNLKNEEIASLFNGMSKSIELSGDSELHQIIEDIGEVYDSSLGVRCSKLFKRNVYPFWKILMVILALCYLILLIIQAFCNAYNCPRAFKSNN